MENKDEFLEWLEEQFDDARATEMHVYKGIINQYESFLKSQPAPVRIEYDIDRGWLIETLQDGEWEGQPLDQGESYLFRTIKQPSRNKSVKTPKINKGYVIDYKYNGRKCRAWVSLMSDEQGKYYFRLDDGCTLPVKPKNIVSLTPYPGLDQNSDGK